MTWELIPEGSGLYRVDRTDPFDFAIRFNETARRGIGAFKRLVKALDDLRDEVLPALQQHQNVLGALNLRAHPDAGQALDHIADYDFNIEIDADHVDQQTLTALSEVFTDGLKVRIEDLPPVSATTLPIIPERLAADWNQHIENIEHALQEKRQAQEAIKLYRQDIKDAQKGIEDEKEIVADARYDIASSLVSMRELQRTAVALVSSSDAPPVIRNAAEVNLRVNVYIDPELDTLAAALPALRFSVEDIVWLGQVEPEETGSGRRSEESGGDPRQGPDPRDARLRGPAARGNGSGPAAYAVGRLAAMSGRRWATR